ncbi:MAG: peptide deformylase [Cyclobacteriaceae bacterium]
MIYPIILFGDPVLKKPAEDIVKDEIDVAELAADMYETMYQANGVGLAAPQIGKSVRMFIIDSSPMEEEEEGIKQVFINPEIIEETGEEWAFEEGCLSIPGIREDVIRQPDIKIKFYDEEWVEHEKSFSGLAARVIQHEYDHVEGILFTDHLSAFKKRLIKSKLANISKGKVKADYRVKAPR